MTELPSLKTLLLTNARQWALTVEDGKFVITFETGERVEGVELAVLREVLDEIEIGC
jgi:hypothetical protein